MTVTLKIEKNVYGGDGLGRLADGRVCFVCGAFEGETIRAEIAEQKKRFVRARLVEVIERSPDRLAETPATIPGMVYAPVTHAAELRMKESQLGNFLERIGHAYARIGVFAGQAQNYRNKVTYHTARVDGSWRIGYREEPSHAIVDVANDPLARPEINQALPSIRAGVLALLTQGAKDVRRRTAAAENVVVRYTLDDGVQWWPSDAPPDRTLRERTGGLKFTVPADGFYQVNPEVGDMLVKAVREAYMEGADAAPHLLDLYCGVGVFGLCCADAARKAGLPAPRLVGVESDRRAVACAKANAAAFGLAGNFFCERVGGSLSRIKAGPRHTVIVDPPRGGLEPNVPGWLARTGAARIIYVSCDPATLTRDLESLVRQYRVVRVRLFDMFPRTARFETLVELEKAR